MLSICDRKHEPVAFDGDECPACAARDEEIAADQETSRRLAEIEKLTEKNDIADETIAKMEQEISELEGTIEDLTEQIDELKHK